MSKALYRKNRICPRCKQTYKQMSRLQTVCGSRKRTGSGCAYLVLQEKKRAKYRLDNPIVKRKRFNNLTK